jgi:hypothetical protein
MSAYAVTGTPEVRVDLQVGRVDLVATDRGDVVVTVNPSNPGRSGDRSAADRVRVDQVGDTVRITGAGRLNLFGSGDSVDVLVEVPVVTTASIDVKYGWVNASGALGACRMNVPYGNITLESATRLDLSMGYGELRVARVAGDAEVRLKSGSARIGRVQGTLRLTGSDASVVVDSVGAAAEVTTSSGAVELGRAAGSVRVRSAYGMVRVGELVRGTAQIDGSYGGVDVGIRRGVSVWLDAVSQHGVVRTDLSASTGPESDDTLELRVRTGYGDITIHRSDPLLTPEDPPPTAS